MFIGLTYVIKSCREPKEKKNVLLPDHTAAISTFYFQEHKQMTAIMTKWREHTGLDIIKWTVGHHSCNFILSKGHPLSSPAAGGYLPGQPPVLPPIQAEFLPEEDELVMRMTSTISEPFQLSATWARAGLARHKFSIWVKQQRCSSGLHFPCLGIEQGAEAGKFSPTFA